MSQSAAEASAEHDPPDRVSASKAASAPDSDRCGRRLVSSVHAMCSCATSSIVITTECIVQALVGSLLETM